MNIELNSKQIMEYKKVKSPSFYLLVQNPHPSPGEGELYCIIQLQTYRVGRKVEII